MIPEITMNTDSDSIRKVPLSMRTLSLIMTVVVAFLCALMWLKFSSDAISADALGTMRWDPERYRDATYFHGYEIFSALVFIVVTAVCWYLTTGFSIKTRILVCTCWTFITAVLIYVAASFATETICNFHESWAAGSAIIRPVTPLHVILCGLAYALPLLLGALLIKQLVSSNTGNWSRLIFSIFLSIFIAAASLGLSGLFNMIAYVVACFFA